MDWVDWEEDWVAWEALVADTAEDMAEADITHHPATRHTALMDRTGIRPTAHMATINVDHGLKFQP